MKTCITVTIVCLAACFAAAQVEMAFPGYDYLRDRSTDIMIVRCAKIPDPTRNSINSSIFTFKAEIVDGLKGTNKVGLLTLNTDRWLHEKELYLVFGQCGAGICTANEEYRVVPLGHQTFSNVSVADAAAGQPMDVRLHVFLENRLFSLQEQMKSEQEEKKHLEQYLKK